MRSYSFCFNRIKVFGSLFGRFKNFQFYEKCANMSLLFEASVETKDWLPLVKLIVPDLSNCNYKGLAGRVGIFGGSLEYTGAPYFAAISALRVGADLVHVFCQRSAASVIKSYSPELIVHPVLDTEDAINEIQQWLERLHTVVIGPGLGRQQHILDTITKIIQLCKEMSKPLIIDADGLYLLSKRKDLIKDYNKVILTPNAVEFKRIFGESTESILENMKILGNGVTVLEKGMCDKIYSYIGNTLEMHRLGEGGSGRRCGGQGDLLSGSLAIFYYWALESNQANPAFTAAFASSFLIKQCNAYAYRKLGRSMVASDMIDEIHNVFEDYFENTAN